MENGSFQSHLSHLDFAEKALGESPRSGAPRMDSTTAKFLAQQVDDLQARLKISMQRLASVEEDLHFSRQEQTNLENRNRGLQDQILIWKEKELLWLQRIEKAEITLRNAKTDAQEKAGLEAEIQRYRKYHEKVKTQIKPYITQLKDYSRNLLTQSQELSRELSNSEFALEKARAEIRKLEAELNDAKSMGAQSLAARTSLHEQEVGMLQAEISQLKADLVHHQARSERMESSLSRQDELENTCIALRREVENAQNLLNSETEGLRVTLQLARNDLTKKNLRIEGLQQAQTDLSTQLHRLQAESANAQDQLVSLRYMWNEKAQENEHLKTRLEALEKLNLELSQKLNRERRQPEPQSNL